MHSIVLVQLFGLLGFCSWPLASTSICNAGLHARAQKNGYTRPGACPAGCGTSLLQVQTLKNSIQNRTELTHVLSNFSESTSRNSSGVAHVAHVQLTSGLQPEPHGKTAAVQKGDSEDDAGTKELTDIIIISLLIAAGLISSLGMYFIAHNPSSTVDPVLELCGHDAKKYADLQLKAFENARFIQVLMLACCLALVRSGLQGTTFGLVAAFGALSNLYGVMAYHNLVVKVRTMNAIHIVKFMKERSSMINVNKLNIWLSCLLLGVSLCTAIVANFKPFWACCVCAFAVLLLLLLLWQTHLTKQFQIKAAEEDESEYQAHEITRGDSANQVLPGWRCFSFIPCKAKG